MKRIALFCALALVVALAAPAYAEVQNIKISGDMNVGWILRNNYDLDKDDNGARGNNSFDYITSNVELQVDADLTDNVSTVVRLYNQRDWDDVKSLENDTTQFDINLDLAYVTLKEMVYSPFTVRIGRQDLWFGKGFVIGAKQRDHEANILADEYTVCNSFDAIRGTLDLDPWTIDMVYSIIGEDNLNESDDVWLLGGNIGYVFDSYNGEAEAYYWHLHDRSGYSINANTAKDIEWIGTVGARGSFEPIPNAYVYAEMALQHGRYDILTTQSGRSRSAMATDIAGDYEMPDIRWTPKVGLEYIYYSGEDEDAAIDTNTWEGWDPIFRGKFDSAIRDFQNVYYATAFRGTNAGDTVLDQDSGVTNQHQLIVKANVKPTNTLEVDGRFIWFWFDEEPRAERSKELGEELDIILTYTYTEDVSFELLAAWFFPGNYWMTNQADTATDVVGSVSVAF